jgi:hypothetical protein
MLILNGLFVVMISLVIVENTCEGATRFPAIHLQLRSRRLFGARRTQSQTLRPTTLAPDREIQTRW